MDGRSSTSKPASPSPSSSSATDIKSTTARPTYSSKLGDPKAAAAAAAAPTARQPPQQQRAWTTNKNPITGRAQTPQQANPNSQNKPSVTSSLREGQRVRITLSTGAEFEGIYNNGTEPTTCRLTMVQQKKLPNSADITNGAKRREQATMSFQRKEITEARVLPGNGGKADGKNMNGNRSAFRTDAAISNSRFAERPLQPWVPDTTDNVDGSLEGLSAGGQGWDQFEANSRLFGLTSNYDENIYTTTIDRNNPNYKDKAAMADRAVREINQSAPATAHVAEERIMDYSGAGDHADEEEKYSGVRRQDLAVSTNRENKYTPPARRAPTGQATVKGAPVDPAIISSQLKAVPTPNQPAAKPEETKNTAQASKATPASSSGNKATEAKPVLPKETATVADKADKADKADNKQPDVAAADKAQPALATATVERDVLALFKNFASHQRDAAEKQRTTKAKQDKETKLVELKKFATSFKLSTPVPTDLIGIIAKDPAKQKQIQEKALANAKEIAKQKETKEKEAAAAKDTETKPPADQPALSATAAPVDSRSPSRPSAPQHTNAPSGAQNRHTGPRNGYNNQPHYQNQQYPRNNRQPQHMGGPQGPQQPGGLGSRLRSIDQHKVQNQHMNPHPGMMDMRIPPTGPANNADPTYGRRVSAMGPTFMGNKLNPNSSEFRPGGGFPQAFLPAGPSQGSSPRSSVNHIVEPPTTTPTPVAGQLIRRKTNAVDPKKCNILAHIQGIKPAPERNWDDNDGLRPAYDTPPTWRHLKEEMEKADSTSLMTYSQYFEQMPLRRTSIATPSTAPAVPSHVPPHQHQLPFHLQHGAQNMAPRQSPHLPPMPLHAGQHAHAPVPYSGPDDHRMMHSNSAQSFASPRMGQVPMAYPPAMNAPGQMQYGQPMMQQYINPAAPPMTQFRSFSNNGQFMPQQPQQMGGQMGGPMMVQQQFMGPNGMVTTGPQMSMYPHPHFIPPNAVPPQPMAGSNGFPSPGRPAAPMMASQGSHQGQQAMYMSPGMAYQQPGYPPQQPAGKFSGPRPQ